MKKMHFPSKTEMERSNQEIIDSYDYLGNAASTTDCTGLIPSEPVSKAELESYQDLYQFEPPYLGSDKSDKADTEKDHLLS